MGEHHRHRQEDARKKSRIWFANARRSSQHQSPPWSRKALRGDAAGWRRSRRTSSAIARGSRSLQILLDRVEQGRTDRHRPAPGRSAFRASSPATRRPGSELRHLTLLRPSSRALPRPYEDVKAPRRRPPPPQEAGFIHSPPAWPPPPAPSMGVSAAPESAPIVSIPQVVFPRRTYRRGPVTGGPAGKDFRFLAIHSAATDADF